MLEIKRLKKSFGKKHVLKEVNFTVKPGEITCLVGVNGTGKTTVMNAIMQLFPIDEGELLIDGEPITVDNFSRISYIPDQIIVLKDWTIHEALTFMRTFYPNFNEKKALEVLDFFKLRVTDRIADLSKGTVAKVNLVMGLALDSDYLIMDEPFTGIDILSREQIAQVFTTKLVEGKGVLLSTHEINEIEHLIDRVVLLQDGRVARDFYLETLRETEGKSVIDVLREVD
ncbi:ABC transporter ATP-binding protein [Aerococcaceae bacterium NML210727]|nr:ABC transporter ATP-binding protein [Aerococcaceae bacterium NML210727]MCW6654406.1 ABC transporter ATP-binding protein [Aerococcaceae bacterium NML201296]MCW6679987.1 ABC transporter ATP-binding protein [Aerococcaceae bacterium NML130460]